MSANESAPTSSKRPTPLRLAKAGIRRVFESRGYEIQRVHPNPYGWLTGLDINSVIDVGANVGQFARLARELLPRARIISFEPLPECYADLIEHFSEDTNFQAFAVALGDKAGELTFHQHGYSPVSSFLTRMPLGIEVFPFTAAQTTRTVPICRLDDLAPEAHIEPEVLVKLDVQGYEDRVIAGGSNTIARARALIVEVGFYPQYEDQALFDDVYQQLRSLGFRYRGSMAQLRHPKDGRVLEADAVFLRD